MRRICCTPSLRSTCGHTCPSCKKDRPFEITRSHPRLPTGLPVCPQCSAVQSACLTLSREEKPTCTRRVRAQDACVHKTRACTRRVRACVRAQDACVRACVRAQDACVRACVHKTRACVRAQDACVRACTRRVRACVRVRGAQAARQTEGREWGEDGWRWAQNRIMPTGSSRSPSIPGEYSRKRYCTPSSSRSRCAPRVERCPLARCGDADATYNIQQATVHHAACRALQ